MCASATDYFRKHQFSNCYNSIDMLAITCALLPTSAPHYCEQNAVTRGQKAEVHKCTFANKEMIYYAGDNNTHLNIARMNKEIKINQINRY